MRSRRIEMQDKLRAYVQKPFQYSSSAVDSARRGNGQVGSMQNIVVAYFWL